MPDAYDWIVKPLALPDGIQDPELAALHRDFVFAAQLQRINPDGAIAMLESVSQRGDARGDARWDIACRHELFRVHWKARRTDQAEQIATAAVERCATTPELADFPARACVHDDVAYLLADRDPIGQLDQIERHIAEALRFAGPDSKCVECITSTRVDLLVEHGQFTDAFALWLPVVERRKQGSSTDQYLSAVLKVCWIARRARHWGAVAEWASLVASRTGIGPDAPPEVFVWHAFGLRVAGKVEEATRALHMAIVLRELPTYTPGPEWYDALAFYYEACGRPDQAADLRRAEVYSARGSAHREALANLELIRLLRVLNEPVTRNEEDLRRCLERLANPEAFLALYGEGAKPPVQAD
jgi:hypothetical protein